MNQGDHEHCSFHKFGTEQNLNMEMHPMFLLYPDSETANALKAFKAGYSAGQEKTGNWISIKDIAPDAVQGNKVLATNGEHIFECEYDDGFWCSIGGDEMTHWMPLPSPPIAS